MVTISKVKYSVTDGEAYVVVKANGHWGASRDPRIVALSGQDTDKVALRVGDTAGMWQSAQYRTYVVYVGDGE